MRSGHKKHVFSALLIIVLGFAAYANSLNGAFLWDDEGLIEKNIYIRNLSNVSKFFTEGIGGGAAYKSNFYRPLQIFTYAADYSLWKLNARGYHLTNILLHVSVALCIYWLVNILFDNRLMSLLTSALFVIHPVHTEAVTYISGRADPLASVFILLSFIFYIKALDSERLTIYALMALSYIAAFLSRENSLILPALLFLYHYTFKKKLKFKPFLVISSIALIYILLRVTALKSLLSNILYSSTLSERIPGFFAAIINYIRLLFLPLGLHMGYGDKAFNIADPKVILGAAALVFLTIYALKKKNTDRLAFFSIFWFFIALLPSSNLYPINAYMAEHWLYLPSIGFFLILARGILSLRLDRIAVGIIALLVCSYFYLTSMQNSLWRDPVAFYERTLEFAPDSFSAHHNLGNVYSEMGKKEEAIAHFRKALEINPGYVNAYNNLGIAYYDIGKKDEAIAAYKKAIEIQPGYAQTYNNLAVLYKDIGKEKEAVGLYKKAIGIDPNDVRVHYNLGNLYIDTGKLNKAIASFKKAVQIDPGYARAYNSLAVAYYRSGRYGLAVKHCQRAIELGLKPHAGFLKALEPHRK